VVWSIIWQLADPIRNGVVKLWVIDPKGGMELAAGRPLFDRFCHGDTSTTDYESVFADLLDDAVQVMRRRQDRLRGVTRLHEPSVGEPLIVLVIDELAALTGWTLDRNAKKRMETALGLLLSQGRAVGVVVVGAVQDPRKDVLPMRDLFPTRIALRLNEPEQVTLTLGAGARQRGALADLIPDSLPGVGYVTVDGIAEPVRVRFSHITDTDITELLNPDRLTLQLVGEDGDHDGEPEAA
jgi:DNA segregation ATPase FtsK/SpoIIIE, S-DNA-T family